MKIKNICKSMITTAVSVMLTFGVASSVAAEPMVNHKDRLEQRYSVMSRKAHKSLLTDVAVVGNKLVVVGERGHILISKDNGLTWKQAKVPTQNLLTGVFFTDEDHGWAVGHEGVILHSNDGGATWTVQFAYPYDPDEPLDDDGAPPRSGQPMLDVWFKNNKEGFVIGAYGYFLYTDDGGKTWQDWSKKVDNIDGWHLNAITSPDNQLFYIAGEAGMLFRSTDGGMTWESLDSPYEGSYFGAMMGIKKDQALIFGLQGHIFKTDDRGETWHEVKTGNHNGLMAGTRIGYRGIVLVGNGGVILSSDDGGDTFTVQTTEDRQSLVGIGTTRQNKLIMVGASGVKIAAPRFK